MFMMENRCQLIKEFPDDIESDDSSSQQASNNNVKKYYDNSPNYDEDDDYRLNIDYSQNDLEQTNSEPDKKKEEIQKSPNDQKQVTNFRDLSTMPQSNVILQVENETPKPSIVLIKPTLNIKRKSSKAKGERKNTMLNVYKSNLIQTSYDYAVRLYQNTDYFIQNKKLLEKIDNRIYIEQDSKKNLDFLEMKLKDVLSTNEQNKEIINQIYVSCDYPPFREFLEYSIGELTMFYTWNPNLEGNSLKEYQIFLLNAYSDLIKVLELKRKKTVEYMNKFKEYTQNVQQTFLEMKNKSDSMKKKK
jgi:hypothetical protein